MLATSDPKSPLPGVGGVNNSSREMPSSIVGQPLRLSFFYRFVAGRGTNKAA